MKTARRERLKAIGRAIKYRNQGLKHLQDWEPAAAIGYFEKALELFPSENFRYKWTLDNIEKARALQKFLTERGCK